MMTYLKSNYIILLCMWVFFAMTQNIAADNKFKTVVSIIKIDRYTISYKIDSIGINVTSSLTKTVKIKTKKTKIVKEDFLSNNFSLIRKDVKEKEDAIKFKLVFEDNFNKSKYNKKFWTSYPSENGKSPWNKYVVDDASLAEVKKGNLVLRARWNPATNLPETGAIQTKNKFSFKYGKIEVRAKFNRSGQGGWPAIWLMPQNAIYPNWPSGGEIDIMERLNNDNFVH